MIVSAAARVKNGLWDAHRGLKTSARDGILHWIDKDAKVIRYTASDSGSELLKAAFADDPDFVFERRIPHPVKRVVGSLALKVVDLLSAASLGLALWKPSFPRLTK